jgi:holliday junction DNA helicase RuvA
MIGYLKGTVLDITPERLLLDVGGVGYEVHISVPTFYAIDQKTNPETPDAEPVGLHIHTHVREDALALFGFWTPLEKLLFEKLIAISGIGPKLARTILSSPPEDLLRALAEGDLAFLSKTPGVGKKTAERILLELKDKVRDLATELPASAQPAASVQRGGDDDLVSALVNLGYKPAHAEEAVRGAHQDAPEGTFHELLRRSLKRLSRV